MNIGCAFERDWDNGVLEINQTPFAKNMSEQYKIPVNLIMSGTLGVDLGPKKDGEPGNNEGSRCIVCGGYVFLHFMARVLH